MAIIILDTCSGFVQFLEEPENFPGDYEDYISETLGYKTDDITWIVLDRIDFFGDTISIYDIKNGLKNTQIFEKIKNKIQQGFDGYNDLYKPIFTESESIEEYGTNEFFGGKREAFEDLLEFIERTKN